MATYIFPSLTVLIGEREEIQ